jgi:hypothetical protein
LSFVTLRSHVAISSWMNKIIDSLSKERDVVLGLSFTLYESSDAFSLLDN